MNKNILFNFTEMSVKDKASKMVVKQFEKAGIDVVSQDVLPKVKRTSGISYREMLITFGDSQKIMFRIKSPGDIYQVLINGRLIPIKNQDNHVKAVTELVQKLTSGRAAFQKRQAKLKVKAPPKPSKPSKPRVIKTLTEKRDGLKETIAQVREEIRLLVA